MSPTLIAQLILAGLVVGAVYALVAIGFVIIYNVTGIINFAQGEFVMLGAMLAITLSQEVMLFGGQTTARVMWPLPVAIASAILIIGLLGAVTYQLAVHPARHATVISLIIITIGLSIALRGLALLAWGTDPRRLPSFTEGPPFKLLGAVLTRQSIWVLAAAALSMLLLYLFFDRTILGKALRASSVNPFAAKLMGIRIHRMALLAFVLSAALGALAGIVMVPSTPMTYDRGLILSLKGFVAAVMGDLTSVPHAVAGALLLGVVEMLGASLLSSGYRDAISFVVLIVVLLLRFGSLQRGRLSAERVGL